MAPELPQLKNVNVTDNFLSGSLPMFLISNLSSLEDLGLSRNDFTKKGSINFDIFEIYYGLAFHESVHW